MHPTFAALAQSFAAMHAAFAALAQSFAAMHAANVSEIEPMIH